MFAGDDQGVVFYETVISFRWQKHTFIECVPMPWDQFELIPGYFKVHSLPGTAYVKLMIPPGIYIDL